MSTQSSTNAVSTHTTWPSAESDTLALRSPQTGLGSAVAPNGAAAGSPVWAQPVADKTGAYYGPSSVQVSMQPHALAAQLGISGAVWSVGSAGVGAGEGAVRVGLDYSSFTQAYGGNYGLRLRLVQLPACALTTPQLAACRVQTPLASTNDAKSSSVSAVVTLGAARIAPSSETTGASASGAVYSDATGTTAKARIVPASTPGAATVLGATDSTGQEGGQGGNYAQDGFSSAGSWAAGGSSGDFTYTYSVPLPGSSSSLAPNVSLSYDSGSVDGKTSNTQAQSSWVGDGWATQDSYVEQNFTPCDDNPEGSAGSVTTLDECYNGNVMTLSLNGASTQIVYDASTNPPSYRLADDNGATVSLVTGSNNGTGTHDTSYWVITERDGTQYYFGRNQLPGWTSGQPATNSVDYERVYAAHSTDPCYSSTASNSYCTMAYKWHLDYVVDAKSEAMAYFYAQDANYYGAYGGTTGIEYIRDSHLDHIDYGFTTATGPFGIIPDRIAYTPAVRCVATDGSCGTGETTGNAGKYPDVPFDLECASGASCSTHAPSFFSTVLLSTITTEQYSTAGASLVPVDKYALTQTEPSTGDATSATLWLSQIQHKGEDFTAGGSSSEVALPPVQFTGVTMPNRVDTSKMPSMYRYRLTQVKNETGGTIGVKYGTPVQCTAAWVEAQTAATASSDTKSCFPVYWTPEGSNGQPTQTLDWFEKYAVTQVLESDNTGGSPAKETDYSYAGPAWHYDDDESVKTKYRTYGQFRGYQSVTTMTGTPANDAPTKQVTSYYQGMDGDYLSPTSTRSVSLPDSQGGGHTDTNALAGKVLESTGYLGNSTWIDHSTIYSYWVSAATATRARTGIGLPDLTANMTGTAETWSEQRLSDGGATNSWRINESDTTYDTPTSDPNFGLPLYTYAHTVPVNAAYDRCTTFTYTPENSAVNLVGLVAMTEVDSVACSGFTEGATSSVPASLNTLSAPSPSVLVRQDDVVSATETYYDGASSITATPSAGLATTLQTATGYSGGWIWRTKAVNTYDVYGRVLTTKDGNGNTTKTAYTLNSAGLTTAVTVTNALSQTTSKTLDPTRGLALTSTDINGVVTTDWYDALGRPVDEWDDSRATTVAANKINTYTVSNSGVSGVVAQTMNSELGYMYVITLVDSLGRTRQVQTSSAAGTGTRLISDTLYDSRGWVSKTNNAYADPNSAPTLAIAALADGTVPNQDDYVYDGLGRVVYDNSEKYATVISTTTTVYNGDATTVIPPTGGVTKTTHTDALGRTGEIDEYTANPSLTTPSNVSTGIFYIGGGTAVPTTYGYDGHGQQYKTTDGGGHSWTSAYDLVGEVLSKNDPTAGTTTYAYDNDGNLTQTQDARSDYVSYTYDALNRKTGQYDAAASAQVAYVSSSAPGNQTAAWVYDNSNNAVVSMTYPLGHVTTETSYANGNAYTTQDTGFNVFGESLGEKTTIPSAEGALAGTYTVTHGYSTNTGLLLSDTYASNGVLGSETVQHGYAGSLDLPNSMNGGGYGYAQSVSYDAWSHPLVEQIGSATNGLATVTDTYDLHTGRLSDQLVQRATATPKNVDETAYTYDLSGNITLQTETRLGSSTDTETQCFRYDTLDRLTTAWSATDACATAPTSASHAMVANTLGTNSAYWTSWSYFNQGSRQTQIQHAIGTATQDTTTSDTYSTTANGELTATNTTGATTGSTGYGYDPAGNMTSRTTPATGAQTLTWDNAGQLTKVATTSAATTYVYDADGNLLLQKDPGTTVLYLEGQQLTLTTATGAETAIRYYPLPGGGVLVRTGDTTNYSFELTDQHGTATLYLDHTAQTPTWRQYDPYGNPRGNAATWLDNRTFLDKPTDATTGLTNVGARYYDPATGRFISLDPVFESADPEALPGYSYADDNPVTQSDPTGLMREGDGVGTASVDNGGRSTSGDPNWGATASPSTPQTYDNLGGLLVSRSDPRYSRFTHLASIITLDASSYGALAPAAQFMDWEAYCQAHIDFCGQSLVTALHSELYNSDGDMIGRSAYGDAIITSTVRGGSGNGPTADFSAIMHSAFPIMALTGVVVIMKVGGVTIRVSNMPDPRPFAPATKVGEPANEQTSEIAESAERTSDIIDTTNGWYQYAQTVSGTSTPSMDSPMGAMANNGLPDTSPGSVVTTGVTIVTNPKGLAQGARNMLGAGGTPSQLPEGEEPIE